MIHPMFCHPLELLLPMFLKREQLNHYCLHNKFNGLTS